MKNLSLIIKSIILTALFTLLFNKVNALSLDSLAAAKIDTTIILTHPNSADSANVVQIVNGAVNVTTIFVKNPLIKTLLNNPIFTGGLVTLILGVWRRIELRRLRKKGVLIDKTFK